jgi:nitroreductase
MMPEKTDIKLAHTDYPVHELIAKRWSPYAYSDKPVSADDLRSIFEAARWAPSCYNEQPWYYIVGSKDDPEQYEKVLSGLTEMNQQWANAAPVLALGVASSTFNRTGKPNRHAFHDLGLASSLLSIEATARGLAVHQMAGILPEKAKAEFGIPDGYEVVTGIAIGYRAKTDNAPEALRQRDLTPRSRRPLGEFVFAGSWGKTHDLITE